MAPAPSFLLVLTTAIIATTLLSISPASAAKCHPDDQKTLLAIKRFWNNPDDLASWVPSKDCCNELNGWNGVVCDSVSGRVITLSIPGQNITGIIPSAVGDLPKLQALDISKFPSLTGPIPSALVRLRRLAWLSLNGNNLTGPVPAFLAQFPKLWYINLEFNRLTGTIPGALAALPKLHHLDLGHNQLTGGIPLEFGKLLAGTLLWLSHNNLSGPLPLALGNVDFTAIDLSANQFSGKATFLLGQSKVKLNYIDLSRNMFEFDLGRVVFPTKPPLRTILFSHNRLYGRIPNQLSELANLESLDLSYNRLCGEIPVGGNLDRFKAEVYAQNQCLCGKPLQPCK